MNNFIQHLKDIISFSLSSFAVILTFIILVLFDASYAMAFIISFIIGAMMFLKHKQGNSPAGQKKKQLKRINPKKEAFYKSKGMSKDEMNFFRETMLTAKLQILDIEKNMKATGKLKAIELRNNTSKILKALFHEITQEPNKLHDVDQFLYVHLPSLNELTNKYIEIDQHKAKNKSTYDALNTSAESIDALCQLIVEDYVSFVSDDIEDLALEVELAKRAIKRDNHANKSIKNNDI